MTAHAFSHQALLYRGSRQWLEAISAFVAPGLAAGEPVMIAVPAAKHELLRGHLGGRASNVTLLDMTPLGGNPARLIGAYTEALAAHPARRAHLVGEPAWPGRTAEENDELIVHEALCNLAFKDLPYRALCPYNADETDPRVLAGVCSTHPHLAEGLGAARPSRSYTEPLTPSAQWRRPLAPPPPHAIRVRYSRPELRLVCEIQDRGHLTDPLAGRLPPRPGALRGRGLWLVNQLADLVQLRTQPDATTIRIHTILA
jgi:DcmR-like sensory protein/histidine kinase-like protein